MSLSFLAVIHSKAKEQNLIGESKLYKKKLLYFLYRTVAFLSYSLELANFPTSWLAWLTHLHTYLRHDTNKIRYGSTS